MERVTIPARLDWQTKVEALGLVYHTADGKPYWNESAYYRFTAQEVDVLEAATNTLHALCLDAAQHILDNNRFEEMGIPEVAIPAIRRAWEEEPPALYGRFDLSYDGLTPPKMLEYNADTPTALLEAGVIQWYWLQDRFPHADQFNSIWEALVVKWSELKTGHYLRGEPVTFAHSESTEDLMTVTMLRDTAHEAGIATQGIHMRDIGWDTRTREFVDRQNRPIRTLFKLYPWEWMLREPFGVNAVSTSCQVQWIEPVWKLLLSSKGILAILWERNPGHPNLLEAYLDGPREMQTYARKPLFSREGANITLQEVSGLTVSPGAYDEGRFVYQGLAPLPTYAGHRPVIGSWVIDGTSHGIGIRESDGPITDNLSQFVPHLFE